MGYLEQVCQAYTHYFAHYTESPLLTINVSDVDYVNHPEDLAQVIATVEQHTDGRRDWHPLPTGRAGKHP
jgi:deoxyadenosine/deoxycytidine kinase